MGAAALAVVILGVGAAVVIAPCRAGASGRRRTSSSHHPYVARPTRRLVTVTVDYSAPLELSGGAVTVPPLEHAVVAAAFEDFYYLKYLRTNDLGGFAPAPVGRFVSTTTGRSVTRAPKRAQIPLLTKVGRRVTIFGYGPGTEVPSTSAPVPPKTVPPTAHTTPKTPVRPPPRSKQTTPRTAFRTPPVTLPPPAPLPTTSLPTSPSTTTTSTPTSTTTTSTSSTTTTSPVHPSTPPSTTTPPTHYVELTETHGHFPVLDVTNMEPGQSKSEGLTLENIGTEPFELALKSEGTTSNTLSSALRLSVKAASSGRVYYDGPLSGSATGTEIAQLTAGATIRLDVTLYLPSSAGNDVQDQTAKVDLYWNASGT
ncbi:MAG: hypothetical protein ACRDWE_01375 [Acidimicrobiales bacterium]